MNILILTTFDIGHVVFLPPIKNVIMKGTFSRVLYTTETFTTTGFYIRTMDIAAIERSMLTAYGSTKSQHLYFKHFTPKPYLIKISGVWESSMEYGLVYKIIHLF